MIFAMQSSIKLKIYLHYIFEVKLRFLYVIFSIINTFFISYLYKNQIIFIITKYLLNNMNSHRFIFTDLTLVLFIHLKLILFISILINIPFLIIHFIYFMINSLYIHELKSYINISINSILIFFFSIYINYNYIFPQILNFFLSFENKNNFFPLHFEAKFEDFFNIFFF